MDDKSLKAVSGGIFLIGLGLLFLIPGVGFWPWILAVIGAAGLPAALSEDKGWAGWQGFFWMIGLAVLFYTGLWWPGILILIGISTILGAATRGQGGSPFTDSDDATVANASDDEDWGSK